MTRCPLANLAFGNRTGGGVTRVTPLPYKESIYNRRNSGMILERLHWLDCRAVLRANCRWTGVWRPKTGTPNRCVYVDKVLPAIEVATSTTREAQWIRESFHIDPTDKQAFQQWLAGKPVFMDKKGTNMHMLWAMIVRKTYGHRMRAIPSVRESV